MTRGQLLLLAATALAPPLALRAQTPSPTTSPRVLFDPARLQAAHQFLGASVDSGAFPGGVLLVGMNGRVAYTTTAGHYGVDDPRPVSDSTIYDLASLTKVIGLTTGVMILVNEGKLDIDRPVQAYVPAFRGAGKERVLVRHLLTHSSGLPAWRPIYQLAADRQSALDSINATPLDTTPGTRFVYSDLGAIVLAEAVEAITQEPLDRFLDRRVFQPLGMRDTRYLPPAAWHSRIAPTEKDPWRGHELVGEVHDENAARLGGVSGHAGLFSTAPDLARFAAWLLDAYRGRLGPNAPIRLPAALVRTFVTRQGLPAGSSRALGWDTFDCGGSGGHQLSAASFGHTGFTGTSIWLDPERDLFIILLTNRVNPNRSNNAIRHVRTAVADLVVKAGGPALAAAGSTPSRCGE
jgi:CubicO group peptidase (beta-lactamase class C family)